jgi:predicted ABC-type ATPase
VIVAGPNGAGKSTYTRSFIADQVPVIDPDRPAPGRPSLISLGRGVLGEVQRRLSEGESFAVETTLSGKLPRKWIALARTREYDVTLHYIALASPEIAIARVRRRVELGGHDVPEQDIRRRFTRSLAELRTLAPLVDRLIIIDNSEDPGYETVFVRVGDQSSETAALPEFLARLFDAP